MLSKLKSRTGLLIDRTSRFSVKRPLLSSKLMVIYQRVAVFGGFCILGMVLIWPIFGPGYPPGVDTPTFLHLSWVTKLAASGQLADPFMDPYWYGGFSYMVAYPPLGYGLVGVISFLTTIDLVHVYTVVLLIAYGGLAAATYWLAIELGLRRLTAVLVGILVTLAYPVLSSIFLWGWFTSLMALPFGLVSIVLLEKSLRSGKWTPAMWGGLFMALSILTHHMTGLSLGLGLLGWFLYHLISGVYPKRQVIAFASLFAAVTALVVAPWGIPFVIHILDAGFRREVPGLWMPDLSVYRTNVLDSTLIGAHTYPSYLGITLIVLTIGGTVYALLERRRLAGLAFMLLVLTWFSLGANANPLVRMYPFSGLDVARFHLFMVPFMALLAGALVERAFSFLKELWSVVSVRLLYALSLAILASILVFPAMDAWKARGLMEPYRVQGTVNEAIHWLAQRSSSEDSARSPLYTVGLWTWHSFLIPYLADQPLVDGWYDEGAPNVHQIRELRLMGWTGNVDIPRAHRILRELGARYVLAKGVSEYPAESSGLFLEGFEAHPEWFNKQQQWGDVAIFEVIQ